MRYLFDEFELDENLYELRRQDEVVKLAPKVFDVLLYLIRNRDRVVSKQELLDTLWAGESVSESVLPTNIAALRKALGDERTDARLIQTVHGRGYRFIASVEERVVPARTAIEAAASVFVGRETVMDELRADLKDALAGHGHVVVLVGEPGIGKTRTTDELILEARRCHARVLEGRGYEGEGAPAFWPWVQILRAAVRTATPSTLHAQMGAGASDIAHLVPELRDRLPDLPRPQALDSEEARFRLFDSVTTFLRCASRAEPLVLVLDDLHWADEPTLLLLGFLAREMRESHILLIGSYRDVDLGRRHPLARLLGELARLHPFRRIPLQGLTAADVASFIESATGREAPDRLVRAVYEMTEGNPLFIHETVRLLVAEGRLHEPERVSSWRVTLPEGVRDVIGRRLATLSEECHGLLGLASVIGREFALGVLERLGELPGPELLELLDEAKEARIITDEANIRGGSLRLAHFVFSHNLIRETLYEELPRAQRGRLHRRLGEILEEVYGAAADDHLAELLHHFFQAAPGGDAEKAIVYGVRAAERSLELLAYEEGISHYQRTLEALDLEVPRDEVRRLHVVLDLGRAQSLSGHDEEATETFRGAADMARRLGRGDLLGHAAMGLGGWPLIAGRGPTNPNQEFRALVEEALQAIGEEHSELRARLLAGLAVTPPDQDSMAARMELSREALDLAERTGDVDALFDALWARQWALLGPDDTAERLANSTRILELANRVGAKEKAFTGHEDRVRSLLVLGEIAAADREIEACAHLAEEIRLPRYFWSTAEFRVTRALLDGRFDEAEKLAARAARLGQKANDHSTELMVTLWRMWLSWGRGRLAEIEPTFESFVDDNAWMGPIAHIMVAFFYNALERHEAAHRHFEMIAAAGFEELARDENWTAILAMASDVCADLGDTSRADVLYKLLRPYAAMNVGHQTGRLFAGSAAHWLARLAAVRSCRKDAVGHFEAALAMNARLGARSGLARTQYELARLLLGKAPGTGTAEPVPAADERQARSLLAEARATAVELGMSELLEKIRRLD